MGQQMKKIKILFTGYYGFNNFGDDLFPLACINGSSLYLKDCECYILSPPIAGIEGNYLVPAHLAKLYRHSGLLGKLVRLVFMVVGAFWCGNLVLAGGSTIASGSSLRMARIQYYLALLGVCNVSAIGVSVGPFWSDKDRQLAASFIKNLKYFSVRDLSSVVECQKLGLSEVPHYFGDLAGALPLEPFLKSEDQRNTGAPKVLGVSVCRYESYVAGNLEVEEYRNLAIFQGVLAFAKESQCSVSVIVLNANADLGDCEISNKLFLFLKKEGVDVSISNYVGPYAALQAIHACDLFFSVRLHGAIVAYLMNIPFSLVEYHHKCKAFINSIGRHHDCRLHERFDATDVVEVLRRLADRQEQELLMDGSEYVARVHQTFIRSPW